MLANFRFDTPSFLIGFFSGLLLWLIVNRLKVASPSIKKLVNANIKRIQDSLTGGTALYIRQVVQKKAQRNHIAFPLFALDEIAIPARFLAPFIENEASNAPGESLIPKILPFMHSCPEMASQYHWMSISLEQALQNGANIAIIGQPGSGKTIALSTLAVQFARKDPTLGPLSENIPLLIHKNDVWTAETQDFLDAIVQHFTSRAPFFIKSQVSGYLTLQARNGNVIILLDGLDQSSPSELARFTKSLSAFQKKYPRVQIVVTSSPDYIDGLLNIGFHPLTIAAWNQEDRAAFLQKWDAGWKASIEPQIKRLASAYQCDSMLIENWITLDFPHLTPLDWTLRIWSIYGGDACGSSPISSLDAFVSRGSGPVVPQTALALIALECSKSQTGAIRQEQVEAILSSADFSKEIASIATPGAPPETQVESQGPQVQKKSEKKGSSSGKILSTLLANGLLVPSGEASLTFVHPVVMGYLASLAYDEDYSAFTEEIFNPKTECLLHYLAVQKKAGPLIADLVDRLDPPFFFNLLMVCRWLKDAPLDLEWRSRLMRQVIKIITQPDLEYAMRANLAGALTASNDPAVSTLFRQLLLSPDEKLRILAALGCGAIQDTKSIHELALLLRDKILDVRIAASLALGIIRHPAALEYIGEAFIQGDETVKQAAAEALSWQGDEGIETLKNGYSTEDMMLRRAVVFGLSFIKTDWSREMIERIAVEDGQWVVRNAAVQALESFNKPLLEIPARLPPPSQAPWLITFAARQGEGVIPGKLPLEILIAALDKGTVEEKLSSLAYLRLISNEEVVRKISQMATNEHGVLKDSAMLSLWFFKVSGIKLPEY